MSKINFFTPLSFGEQSRSHSERFLERIDDYFYLGGKKACVIAGEANKEDKTTLLVRQKTPFLLSVLKILSYFTVIIPLVMLISKAIARQKHHFHLIDAKQELEKGIGISEDTIAKIKNLMPKILNRKTDEEVTYFGNNNPVFSLASAPGLIFKKVYQRNDREPRFDCMLKAKEICILHGLDKLIIPHAKQFEVNGDHFIAEERIDIVQNESAQEELHKRLSPGLEETVKQLVTFIAKTGFSDVEWRNIPIANAAPDGQTRIALVDLEEMDGAGLGIFGCEGGYMSAPRRGLIRCLHSEKLIDAALAEARRHKITSSSAEQVKANRMREIQDDDRLQQFHTTQGILDNPRKPIEIDDLASLGLDLDARETIHVMTEKPETENGYERIKQPITLKEVVLDVIAVLNKAIAKTPEDASTKGKREYLLISTNDEPFREYGGLGLPCKVQATPEELKQRWLYRIVNALIEKGHLFKLQLENGNGFYVQA